ncbi:glutathione S-transferase-like [Hydractinia symbiolongicarpus]|uniref:glutathione S-transferase-like n=1 Tax=Hydractinia symbiolongicarpus TaxID=13093 RepID=UPI002551BC61|nr:glutathione S-transferase-like [Hydractinia symbiolongicarpus]
MAPKYILTYFPIGGRAECARLMFRVAGVEFEDVQHHSTHWQTIKNDVTQFPLAQMPKLEVDGHTIIQTGAIVRYLAHEFGFYGACNKERSTVDQVCETMNEHLENLVKIMFNKETSDEEKQKGYDEYFESDQTKRYFNYLTKLLKTANDGKNFFLGEKISLADFYFFSYHDMIKKDCPSYLKPYPELKALVDRVGSIEAIKKHMETRTY